MRFDNPQRVAESFKTKWRCKEVILAELSTAELIEMLRDVRMGLMNEASPNGPFRDLLIGIIEDRQSKKVFLHDIDGFFYV